ncbi:MAG: GTP-binding protein [Pseudomonadota bacterium]
MRHRAPIPAVVIGGFLGSGKTTMLNALLAGDHGLRAGVIVNDFGAINIDAQLVAGVEEDMIALSNGCICCSIRGDLVSACLRMLDRADAPEILFIESSGVSDPAEIARSLDLAALQPFLRIESLVCVADAERLPLLLDGDAGALARAQLALADLVILNKTDLVAPEALAEVEESVGRIAHGARLYRTTGARVPCGLLFGTHDTHRWSERPATGTAPSAHPFETFHWRTDMPLSLPRLQSALSALPSTVFRAKGIVWLEELAACRTVLQMVGPRHNLRDGLLWGTETPGSDIVLIGAAGRLDRLGLADRFNACIGEGDASASPILRLARRIAPHLTAPPREIRHGHTRN